MPRFCRPGFPDRLGKVYRAPVNVRVNGRYKFGKYEGGSIQDIHSANFEADRARQQARVPTSFFLSDFSLFLIIFLAIFFGSTIVQMRTGPKIGHKPKIAIIRGGKS